MKSVVSVFIFANIIFSFAQAQPEPVPESGVLRFSELARMYNNGVMTSEAQLKGRWLQVARATNAECGYNFEDSYDKNGLENSDGSKRPIEFLYVQSGGGDFSDSPGDNIFSVKLFNLGGRGYNQGPYKVNPQEPQFSSWAYSDYNLLVDRVHIEYGCHFTNSTGNKLVCLSQLRMPISDPFYKDEVVKACVDSGKGMAYAYIKL